MYIPTMSGDAIDLPVLQRLFVRYELVDLVVLFVIISLIFSSLDIHNYNLMNGI